ncbi:MAG: SDR family oxidoreductase [Chloroflexi bacterium]|nr:SDR family oxidoreductase [Chloroflexota bacterium]
MTGKVCLVTGATAGIGKVTATALAAMGADLTIVGRNKEKTENTLRQIKTETGNESIQYLLADFSDLAAVRKLAENFKEKHSKLDVLVNNAGAYFNSRKETSYDVEMTLLVNHLAPFLLTNLLLETIQKSEAGRIVNVSSNAHHKGTMDFDDLGFKKKYSGMAAYGRSKLANVLFSYELARRLGESNITVNALHPGVVTTDIWKTNFPIIGSVLKWVIGLFALSVEEGADNTIYLATSPEVEKVTGKYFVKRDDVLSSELSYDEDVARKLWEISEGITKVG